ncbi:MAG: hypothetical protein QXK69_01050 [Candidatus Caldarchaeum sp.]
MRKGFKQWVDEGFPRDPETGKPPSRYFQRGKEEFVKVSYEEAFEIIAKAIINIVTTYSGEEGRRNCLSRDTTQPWSRRWRGLGHACSSLEEGCLSSHRLGQAVFTGSPT